MVCYCITVWKQMSKTVLFLETSCHASLTTYYLRLTWVPLLVCWVYQRVYHSWPAWERSVQTRLQWICIWRQRAASREENVRNVISFSVSENMVSSKITLPDFVRAQQWAVNSETRVHCGILVLCCYGTKKKKTTQRNLCKKKRLVVSRWVTVKAYLKQDDKCKAHS